MTSTPTPTAASERLAVLDVLRGFALFGVFMVNMAYASGPMTEGLGADMGLIERSAATVIKTVFETKFVTLFSLLFGMGLVLQFERAKAKQLDIRGTYKRRLALLCGMGLLHGLLLFSGDILFFYSLVGLLLYLCRDWPVRRTLGAAALFALIGIALSATWAFFEGLDLLGGGPGNGSDAEVAEWEDRERRAITKGPLSLTLQMRAMSFALLQVVFFLISFNWRVIALFFLGAVLMRTGFLAKEKRALHGRLAVAFLVTGAGLEAFFGYVDWAHHDVKGALALVATVAHEVGSLLLGFAFGCAVAWAVHGRTGRWAHALSNVGRMALTNYLAQSVLMNVVLFWYGFGLWNQWPLWSYMALVTALFAGQIAVSSWWMSRFKIGPAEWAWRSLTYGERQAWTK